MLFCALFNYSGNPVTRYVLAGLVLGLLLGQSRAAAPIRQKLEPILVLHVLDRVVQLGEFKRPPALPPVYLVSADQLPQKPCASGALSCRTLGVFFSHEIRIDHALDSETQEHVLAHELVHFLQALRDGPLPVHPDARCRAEVAAEREAYRLQWEYRSIRQGYTGPAPRIADPC